MPNPLVLDYLERSGALPELQFRPASAACGCSHDVTVLRVHILLVDQELCMLVGPDHMRPDFGMLALSLGAAQVRPAPARQYRHHFFRCDADEIPPFGHLFGLRAFCFCPRDSLHVQFSTGRRGEVMRMRREEFLRFARADALEADALISSPRVAPVTPSAGAPPVAMPERAPAPLPAHATPAGAGATMGHSRPH